MNFSISNFLKSPVLRILFVAYATFACLYTTRLLLKSPEQPAASKAPDTPVNPALEEIDFSVYGVNLDQENSQLSSLSPSIIVAKIFSKYLPNHLDQVQPYWKKAKIEPDQDDITITMVVTDESFNELIQLANDWNGPISATLHITAVQPYSPETSNVLEHIKTVYSQNPALYRHVDLHLIVTPPTLSHISLVNINMDRNMARLFARSDFILYLEPGIIPVTDFRKTFKLKKMAYLPRLRDGDVFVLPVFASVDNSTIHSVPRTKKEILKSVNLNQIGMFDSTWELGTGPTCYEIWKTATKAYAVEEYEFHYAPMIIMSRDLSFWCPDRFIDNDAACVYGIYLGGAEFWVLPDDYAVRRPSPANAKSNFEAAISNRMYKKFQWELCGQYGRQLYAMGLWDTERTHHVKKQCARVLTNWGRGLIGA